MIIDRIITPPIKPPKQEVPTPPWLVKDEPKTGASK
jgi:hypothetical protein